MTEQDNPGQDSRPTLAECIQIGRNAANSGRPEVAERLFQNVLTATRGTGSREEIDACSSLVTLYSREQRDFETLPLARRLVRYAHESQDPALICKAQTAILCAFNDLEDYERVLRELVALEAAIGELPADSDKRLQYRRVMHGIRSDAELMHGDFARTARELFKFRETFEAGDVLPGEQRWLLVHDAHVALHLGHAAYAQDVLDRALALDLPPAIGGLAMGYLSVWCALELEGAAAARSAAEGMLDELGRVAPQEHGQAQRVRYLTQVAELLHGRCAAPELARRAYDLAGAAMIGRMGQLDQFLGRTSELEELSEDDMDALASYRRRFKERHRELLGSVVELFRDVQSAEEYVPSGPPIYLLCARCERACTVGNKWLPIGHLVPEDASLRIRHVICPECAGSAGA